MSDNIFKCPKCGSDNIQSYEVIYNSGRASHVSTTDGVSFGSDFSVGHATTYGNSVTDLAQTCAPPTGEIYHGYVMFVFYGILSCVLGAIFFAIHPIAAIIGICFPIYKWIKRVTRVNAERNVKLTKARKQWRRSYYCHRCGNRFIINEDDDA